MSVQLALSFDERCLSPAKLNSGIIRMSFAWPGNGQVEEQADVLGISNSTLCRWLRQFREGPCPGCFLPPTTLVTA